MIRLIAAHELRSLFALPSTWVMLGVLEFLLGWSLLSRMDAWLELQPQLAQLANAPGVTASIAAPMCSMLSLLLLILTPLFTMRSFAEERRNQTDALLLSSPVTPRQLVLGKFFGVFGLCALLIVAHLLLVGALALGTPLDRGLLFANLLGLLLLAMSYSALGLYISTLTAQPIVAAIGGLATLLGLWLAEASSGDAEAIWHNIAPSAHFQHLNAGLLDSADIAFFLLFTLAFLLLATCRVRGQQ
jgi:ABC-2 type transport system permease protein